MKKWWKELPGQLGKYKYAVLVLLIGGALLLLPKEKQTQTVTELPPAVVAEVPLSEQLEQLLSQVEGAGKTRVLLTPSGGTIYEYQADTRSETGGDGQSLQTETVLAAAGSGKEEPLVVRTTYSEYIGAVVVCEGADRASVRLNIINAVSGLTGLGSDRITVIKMKGK